MLLVALVASGHVGLRPTHADHLRVRGVPPHGERRRVVASVLGAAGRAEAGEWEWGWASEKRWAQRPSTHWCTSAPASLASCSVGPNSRRIKSKSKPAKLSPAPGTARTRCQSRIKSPPGTMPRERRTARGARRRTEKVCLIHRHQGTWSDVLHFIQRLHRSRPAHKRAVVALYSALCAPCVQRGLNQMHPRVGGEDGVLA